MMRRLTVAFLLRSTATPLRATEPSAATGRSPLARLDFEAVLRANPQIHSCAVVGAESGEVRAGRLDRLDTAGSPSVRGRERS